ncbi:MAG: hypothetical protein FWF10_02175 [Clostridiales bacterium]|nr:hypothetical protein [Clostridiales bacterium]
MLQYNTPKIEIIKLRGADILVDSSIWLGDDDEEKPPGDGTKPGWPTDATEPSSLLDLLLGG